MTRNTVARTTTANAAPKGQSNAAPNSPTMPLPIMMPLGPPSNVGVTKSPKLRQNVKVEPAITPGTLRGSVMRRNVCKYGRGVCSLNVLLYYISKFVTNKFNFLLDATQW